MGPAEVAAPQPRRAHAQLLDNINDVPYAERIDIIAASWRAATNPLAPGTILHSLHRVTLLCMLNNEWSRLEKSMRDDVTEAVEKCADAIKASDPDSIDEKRLRYLLRTSEDPWHHPVLKDIMRGRRPNSQDVLSWLREEGCTGALERLRQLSSAKGPGEGAALRLADVLVPLPPSPPTLPANFRCKAMDTVMVLLMRANRTSDCIAHIKTMDSMVGCALITKLASRNKSEGRIWKNAHDTALLCTQVLVATSLVRPIDNQLGTLAAQLASLYASRSEELAPALRKLLQSADTATHIYVVCRAVQHQFGDTMRPFICELYIRALTTGVNELERQKHQDEAGTSTSHQLADWFLSLADLLSPNPIVSAECVLTAFSLHPSKLYYGRVKECSVLIKQKSEPQISENSLPEDEKFDLALNGLESSLNSLQMAKDTYRTSLGCANTEPDPKPDENIFKIEEIVPQSLVSGAVIEGEGLELSSDLCHDLVVLLSGPRLKMLTWDLSWEKLSEYCLSYMADTEEGTKTVTTELKYVHLDYSQYEIKEPEIHDIYFGIEKGYEHHLEIEEDEWDEEEVKIRPAPVFKEYDESETDSGDCIYYDDSGHKRVCKKSKKKAIKKPLNSDHDIKSNGRAADKVKPVKKERKPKDKSERKKNNSIQSITNFNKINPASMFLGSSGDSIKNEHSQIDNKQPVPSFYRMQMEMYEAHKKKVESMMFGNYTSIKTEDVSSDNSNKLLPTQYNPVHTNQMYSTYPGNSSSTTTWLPYRSSNQNFPHLNYSARNNTDNSNPKQDNESNYNDKKSKSSLLSFRKQNANLNPSSYLNQDLSLKLSQDISIKSEYSDREQSFLLNKAHQYSTSAHSPNSTVNNHISSLLGNSSVNSTNQLYNRMHLPQTETNVNVNRNVSFKSNQELEKKSTLNELSLLKKKLLILTGKQDSDIAYKHWPESSPPLKSSSVHHASSDNLRRYSGQQHSMKTYSGKHQKKTLPNQPHSVYKNNKNKDVLTYGIDPKFMINDTSNRPHDNSEIKYDANLYQTDVKNVAEDSSRTAYGKQMKRENLNNLRKISNNFLHSNIVKTFVKQEYNMSYDDIVETQINRTVIDSKDLLREVIKDNLLKTNHQNTTDKYSDLRYNQIPSDLKLTAASSSNEPFPREYNKFKSKLPPNETQSHPQSKPTHRNLLKDKPTSNASGSHVLLKELLFGKPPAPISDNKEQINQLKVKDEVKPVDLGTYSVARSPKKLSDMMENDIQKIYKLTQSDQQIALNLENPSSSDVKLEMNVTEQAPETVDMNTKPQTNALCFDSIHTDVFSDPKMPDLYEKQESIAKTKINQQSDAIYQKFLAEVQSSINVESNMTEATPHVDGHNYIDNINSETTCSSQTSNVIGDTAMHVEIETTENKDYDSNLSINENIESSCSHLGISPRAPILFDENAQTDTIRPDLTSPDKYASFEMDFVASNVEIKSPTVSNENTPTKTGEISHDSMNDFAETSKESKQLDNQLEKTDDTINIKTMDVINSIVVKNFPLDCEIDKLSDAKDDIDINSINDENENSFIDNIISDASEKNKCDEITPLINTECDENVFVDNIDDSKMIENDKALVQETELIENDSIKTIQDENKCDENESIVESSNVIEENVLCTNIAEEDKPIVLTEPSKSDPEPVEIESQTPIVLPKPKNANPIILPIGSLTIPNVIVSKADIRQNLYKLKIIKNPKYNKASKSISNTKTNLETKSSKTDKPIISSTNNSTDKPAEKSSKSDKSTIKPSSIVLKNFQKKELVIKIHRININNLKFIRKDEKIEIKSGKHGKGKIEHEKLISINAALKENKVIKEPIKKINIASEIITDWGDRKCKKVAEPRITIKELKTKPHKNILETINSLADDDAITRYSSTTDYSPNRSTNFSDSNTLDSDFVDGKETETESGSHSNSSKQSENIEIKSEKSSASQISDEDLFDDLPICSLIDKSPHFQKIKIIRKSTKKTLLKNKMKSSRSPSKKEKNDSSKEKSSKIDIISILDDSSEDMDKNDQSSDSSSTSKKCSNVSTASKATNTVNDIIDLSSDSDVEIVISNDPIAVDPIDLNTQTVDPLCMTNKNYSPIMPLFFTVVQDIKIPKNNKVTWRGGRKRRSYQRANKNSESLIIYNEDSSKIIKISKMPKADCEKFQKPCFVKLYKENLNEIRDNLFVQPNETKICKTPKKTVRKVKKSLSPIKSKGEKFSKTKLKRVSKDMADDDDFLLVKIKEENIDKTIDPTECCDIFENSKIDKINLVEDVEKCNLKDDNLNINTNDIINKVADGTSECIDTSKPEDECVEENITTDAQITEEEASIVEDIASESKTDEFMETNSLHDFEFEIDNLNNEQRNMSSNKTLISKGMKKKSHRKISTSNNQLSDTSLSSTDEDNTTHLSDTVLDKSESCNNEISSDCLQEDFNSSVKLKTYKKPLYQNKRKFKFDAIRSIKKICKSSKIDLPKLSKKDRFDCYQVKIEEEILYDRVQLMSIKQLLLMDNDEYDENIDNVDEDLDMNLFHTTQTTPDGPHDVDRDFIKTVEDNRDSIYSPIFSDELYTFDDKTFPNENVNSNNHISQVKGFGDWSGRGNRKDSSRGSTESPAAVLSDAVTTRPPLALHNYTNSKTNDNVTNIIECLRKVCYNNNEENSINPEMENELNNILLTKKMSKNNSKDFLNYNDENITDIIENLNAIKSMLAVPKSLNKGMDTKKNWKVNKKANAFDKIEHLYDKSLLDRVPGLNDLQFMTPSRNNAVVQVVQLGQLPVSTAQQNSLSDTSTRSQASNEFLNLSNSVDHRSPQNEMSQQSNDIENNVSDFVENSTDTIKSHVTDGETENKPCDEATPNDIPPEIINNDVSFENLAANASSELNTLTAAQGTNSDQTLDKPIHLELAQSTPEEIFPDAINNEQKDNVVNNSVIENHIGIVPTSTHNFIATSRGQALVNLLSQKIIHSPGGGQHLQMATFPKGATINALSLQQALAQILPPPLSQSSGESVIHSAGHSQVGTSQVVHIVQGKSTTPTSTGTFGNLLVDGNQSSVINNTGTTQVLHIVQGKHTNSNNSGVLNQSQFSGLSLVEAGVQQSGNQVLHIVNTGVQSKNNTTGQVLKRVNLLTSITNSQGNNEQKMVQFVCKAPDGKSIQLNTQPQRGMVLRLQPIDNSNFKTSETTSTIVNTSVQSAVLKPNVDQSQQELKSRSVYEENYAKFIQNSSQVVPSSPEKSVSLPKFNQAFGKSVYQDNNSIPKTNENMEVTQNSTITNEQHTPSQDLTTLNLSQLGHISNPPLLIRKAQQSNILHQNVMQQVKQSIAPMNIQTIHGGVIYTRQIPVNIGGGQTINLITVPSSDIIDEVQLQSIQKQNQEKAASGEQLEPQVIKLVSQDQQQSNNSVCHIDTSSDDTNQSFAEQVQNSVNNHPLLTQMRIKVPMLSKGGGQVVTGARVVRPVLQIQRNLIPGSNPAVYQQLVLTTAPTVRQPAPTTTAAIRPTRPPTTHQESNLSSSTLEQLREFDMVLEQVKERSTVQPGNNSNSNFSDASPQCQTTETTELDSPQSSVQPSAQREVLYSIGPNQTVNVTYVNQKVIAKTSTTLTTSYGSTETNVNLSQNSPSTQITHGLTNVVTHSKPCNPNPAKVSSKSIKSKPSKPSNPSNSNTSKSAPVAAKTSLQKPLEDEQTTQRILYILAEYKEQVENSPDKDKPAPRRRSNPPTNPTTSSKRKKGSGGSSKKSGSGQSLQEMSPLGDDAGHTMGSEDSSCGLSQGECTDNSIQGTENQSPQSSPQKSAKKILFQPETESPTPIAQQQQRNVLIADGQAITMTRPGTGKATAVLMPANYLLPMSMVKGSQQITIVTNQGPKILSVPQGEGGTTNALFLQRLIGPAGLKPMLARPGQVRHVRLPASTVQNLQAFNLNSSSISNSENSWVANSSNSQPKLLVEYNSANAEMNSDTNTDANSESMKDGSSSVGSDNMHIKLENPMDSSSDVTGSSTCVNDNILLDQAQNSLHDSNIQNVSDLPTFQSHMSKASGNNTLNLIQVHSLNPECGKLYSVQNSSGITSLIQLSGKPTLNQHQENINRLNEENADGSMDIQDSAVSQFETHYLNTKKVIISHDNKLELSKETSVNSHMDASMPVVDGMVQNQQTFILSHGVQQKSDGDAMNSNQRDDNHAWSGNDNVAHGNGPSPSFVNFENSPQTISQREEQHNIEGQESVGMRDLAAEGSTRILRHPYSPSSPPSGPRHLYHKMFITTPIKKSFNADLVEHSTSSTEEDKQYIQRPLKKKNSDTPSTKTVTFHNNSTTFTIHHHHHNPQVVSICHPDRKSCTGESMDVTSDVSVGRGNINQSAVATHHSVASLRHKYAVMEHELRLQKSLSEECEDLGVDSPSASDLFPEAELLFAASPSSQFDQSQDGCAMPSGSQNLTPNIAHGSSSHQLSASSSLSTNIKESRLPDVQTIDPGEESEFARMHPNTTFHSGEIELVGDDPENAAVNISFRGSSIKHTHPGTHILTKRGDVVRSVIEGIGNSGSSAIFPPTKINPHFSISDLPRRTLNAMTAIQSSDDYSEGADDSMNSAESKDCLANNKSLDGILSNDIVKRDLNLASTESPICISSNIIQRNITQVIRHASSDQLSLPSADDADKLHNSNLSELGQNGNFLLDGSNDNRPTGDSSILKSIMMERDGRDALTCSSPEQHSELFWESNSNSNQSEEQIPPAPPNLLDFSSEDSNKCCKSPLSCDETNSTDSSSLGGLNSQPHNSHPLRINSVIKSSASNTGAAEGPILHSALLSNNPNIISQDISKKMPITLNSVHKSDSNTSSSPDDSNRSNLRKSWNRGIKGSGRRRILSPQSLSTEINMGAEIETSSSEGVSIFTKPSGGSVLHSGSSTPEEGSGNNRRVSLRGPGGVKRSCHCCGGVPTPVTPASTSSSSRRVRRKPASLH